MINLNLWCNTIDNTTYQNLKNIKEMCERKIKSLTVFDEPEIKSVIHWNLELDYTYPFRTHDNPNCKKDHELDGS